MVAGMAPGSVIPYEKASAGLGRFYPTIPCGLELTGHRWWERLYCEVEGRSIEPSKHHPTAHSGPINGISVSVSIARFLMLRGEKAGASHNAPWPNQCGVKDLTLETLPDS